MSWMSFLSPNHRCQNTEGNTKHWCERVAWPHPFFIHHQLMLEEELLPLRWISDASICDNYEVINGKCIVPHEAWYYSENEYLITTWCQLCFRYTTRVINGQLQTLSRVPTNSLLLNAEVPLSMSRMKYTQYLAASQWTSRHWNKTKIWQRSSPTYIQIHVHHAPCLLLSCSSFSDDVALSLIFDLHWLLRELCYNE